MNKNTNNNKNSNSIANNNEPLDLIENLNERLHKEIFKYSTNKKNHIYKLIINCYQIFKEIEDKIQQEKHALEQLLEERIKSEKLIYHYELNSTYN